MKLLVLSLNHELINMIHLALEGQDFDIESYCDPISFLRHIWCLPKGCKVLGLVDYELGASIGTSVISFAHDFKGKKDVFFIGMSVSETKHLFSISGAVGFISLPFERDTLIATIPMIWHKYCL